MPKDGSITDGVNSSTEKIMQKSSMSLLSFSIAATSPGSTLVIFLTSQDSKLSNLSAQMPNILSERVYFYLKKIFKKREREHDPFLHLPEATLIISYVITHLHTSNAIRFLLDILTRAGFGMFLF